MHVEFCLYCIMCNGNPYAIFLIFLATIDSHSLFLLWSDEYIGSGPPAGDFILIRLQTELWSCILRRFVQVDITRQMWNALTVMPALLYASGTHCPADIVFVSLSLPPTHLQVVLLSAGAGGEWVWRWSRSRIRQWGSVVHPLSISPKLKVPAVCFLAFQFAIVCSIDHWACSGPRLGRAARELRAIFPCEICHARASVCNAQLLQSCKHHRSWTVWYGGGASRHARWRGWQI